MSPKLMGLLLALATFPALGACQSPTENTISEPGEQPNEIGNIEPEETLGQGEASNIPDQSSPPTVNSDELSGSPPPAQSSGQAIGGGELGEIQPPIDSGELTDTQSADRSTTTEESDEFLIDPNPLDSNPSDASN